MPPVDVTRHGSQRQFRAYTHSASRSLADFLAGAVTKGSVTITYRIQSTRGRMLRMGDLGEVLSRIRRSLSGQPRSFHQVSVSGDLKAWSRLQKEGGASRRNTTLGLRRRMIKMLRPVPEE